MPNSQEQSLLPAYLVTGADELKRETVVRRLHQRLEKEGDISLNFDEFNGEDARGEEIVAACNTLPFASNIRLVQVENADRLKKADQDPLIAYLGDPSPSCVLCLVTKGLTKNTRLYKAVAKLGRTAVIDCTPPKRRDMPAQIRSMAVTHGITLTPSAAGALLDLVGENTVALDAQLQKIALAHRGSDPVNDSEVASLVSRTAEAKPWEFVDAFAGRNIQKCLVVAGKLGDKSSPYVLMSMCVTRIRELLITRALMERGQQSALPSVLHVPAWRVKNHASWARLFTKQELHRALKTARDTEQAMKSGSDPDAAFQQWWLSVLARPR